MEKQRIVYLDVLRVLVCCMIVLMHTPHPDEGVPGLIQVPLYFLTAAGLVLFFMVSGALLLPAKGDAFQWLRYRMGKILGPTTLFWTYMFIMRHVLWKVDFIVYGLGWVGQLVVTWLLTMLLSFAITYAISLLPLGE